MAIRLESGKIIISKNLDHLLWAFSWLFKKQLDGGSQQLQLHKSRLLWEAFEKAFKEFVGIVDPLRIFADDPDHRCLQKRFMLRR